VRGEGDRLPRSSQGWVTGTRADNEGLPVVVVNVCGLGHIPFQWTEKKLIPFQLTLVGFDMHPFPFLTPIS
jgi:hypothetical protein